MTMELLFALNQIQLKSWTIIVSTAFLQNHNKELKWNFKSFVLLIGKTEKKKKNPGSIIPIYVIDLLVESVFIINCQEVLHINKH